MDFTVMTRNSKGLRRLVELNMNDITTLEECLLFFMSSKNHIGLALEVVEKNGFKDEKLKFTICNYLLILLCSFLEKWKVFVTLVIKV